MHELSIAQSISEIAKSELRARPLSVLRRIGLRIGGLSGVHAESLQFCFEAIIKGTELEGCTLVIEHLPMQPAVRGRAVLFLMSAVRFGGGHSHAGVRTRNCLPGSRRRIAGTRVFT